MPKYKVYSTSQSSLPYDLHTKMSQLQNRSLYHNQHSFWVYAKSRAAANRICQEMLGCHSEIFTKNYSCDHDFDERDTRHVLAKLNQGILMLGYTHRFISFEDLLKYEGEKNG